MKEKLPKTNSAILRSIRAVIGMEADTLLLTRAAINKSFADAVRLLAACRGKIIVTGTGKSGLIGQKIAATFASTGTPALYLHPTDCLHGSLGTIQRKDLVLAIGKSGESHELLDILPALQRLRVKIIVLSASPRSSLARGASLALTVPLKEEACPLDLAPTCSTTAALAVGDALAVTLMKLRGFHQRDFAQLHPGGQLGKRLTLTVGDIMHAGKNNPTVRIDAPASKMLIELTRKHTGAVSIVDRRGRLVGLITDYDLRRILEKGADIRAQSLRSIMNPRPTHVQPKTLAIEAMRLMLERKKPFAVLPVVDAKGIAVGMIHLHDIREIGL